MTRSICLTLICLLACGCASERKSATQPCILPKEAAQPRLREVLVYLADHGFPEARRTPRFDFTVWALYDETCWEDLYRKPRFEAASFEHDGAVITVGVSPIKAYHSDGKEPEKLIPVNADDPAKPQGFSIVLEGRRWTLKYTTAGGTAALDDKLTQLLQAYVREFARRVEADESLRTQPEPPDAQPALDLQM